MKRVADPQVPRIWGKRAAIRPKVRRNRSRRSTLGSENASFGVGRERSNDAMKLFAGWVASAGLILAAWGANAQMLAPYDAGRARYQSASDFDAPYGEPPSTPAPPSYGHAPNFGYGWDYDDGGRC